MMTQLLTLALGFAVNLSYAENHVLPMVLGLGLNTPSVFDGRPAEKKDFEKFPWVAKAKITRPGTTGAGICTAFLAKGNCAILDRHCLEKTDEKGEVQRATAVTICPGQLTSCYVADPGKMRLLGSKGNSLDVAVIKLKASPLPQYNFELDNIIPTESEFKRFFRPGESECVIMGYGDNEVSESGDTIEETSDDRLHVGTVVLTGFLNHGNTVGPSTADGHRLKALAAPSRLGRGDSGGPMACLIQGKWKIVGVNESFETSRRIAGVQIPSLVDKSGQTVPASYAKANYFTALHRIRDSLDTAFSELKCGEKSETTPEEELEALDKSWRKLPNGFNDASTADIAQMKTLIKQLSELPKDLKIKIKPGKKGKIETADYVQENYDHYEVFDEDEKKLGTFALYRDEKHALQHLWLPKE